MILPSAAATSIARVGFLDTSLLLVVSVFPALADILPRSPQFSIAWIQKLFVGHAFFNFYLIASLLRIALPEGATARARKWIGEKK